MICLVKTITDSLFVVCSLKNMGKITTGHNFRRTMRWHKKIKGVYYFQGQQDLHMPLKHIPRTMVIFSVDLWNIKKKKKQIPATPVSWTVKIAQERYWDKKLYVWKKKMVIQTIYFFWFMHESFPGHTWKRFNLRKHFARSCVSKKNNITAGRNHDGLIHMPFFFISCKWHSSKSAILRHMAAQKLTQHVRGIWVSGQAAQHLVRLWVRFLQCALSLGTSFTAHFPQSNGLGVGKYPRHTKHI